MIHSIALARKFARIAQLLAGRKERVLGQKR